MRSTIRQQDLIRVSEISEYVFCRRSWFLSAQGIRPSAAQIERRRAGILRHHRHKLLVDFSRRMMNAATYVLISAWVIAAAYWFWTHAR
jgi:CRISPR/Cas system-associated exonuclease Cas4 (RecB family)